MVTLFWVGLAYMLFTEHRGTVQRGFAYSSAKFSAVFKNPIFLAVSAFILLVAVSTVFAANPYRAFWGDIERGEGLVGLLFFFGFFTAALIMFTSRDWRKFFGLTLVAFAALFADHICFKLTGSSVFAAILPEHFAHIAGSLTGNPTFLAAFYLFAIFSAAMLLASRPLINADKKLIFADKLKITGLIAVILAAAAGIFLTGTRGAIAGLGMGIIAVLLFFVFYQRKSVGIRVNQRLRKTSAALLAVFLIFTAVFIATRHASFWQKIPGLDEIARLRAEDPTLRTRLISAGVSLDAMNPRNEGTGRFLFGWGQEHFQVAYNAYYNPMFLRYEHTWFDRAHNKLLDVLVMNGVLGLLAYLALWFFAFRVIVRRVPRSLTVSETRNNAESYAEQRGYKPMQQAALLFFGVAYFVQNLFAFDSVSTYIPFFAFLAFVASQYQARNNTEPNVEKRGGVLCGFAYGSAEFRDNILQGSALIVALFFSVILIVTLIAFSQSVSWVKALRTQQAEIILRSLEELSAPYTFAQTELRANTLSMVMGVRDLSHPTIQAIFAKSLLLAQESANREKINPRTFLAVASGYEIVEDLKSAEKYRYKALALSPKRQDLLYPLALIYARQGRSEEAMEMAEQMRALDPDSPIPMVYYAVILAMTGGSQAFDEATSIVLDAMEDSVRFRPALGVVSIMRTIFEMYTAAFYHERNAERFLEAMNRAKRFEERYEALIGSQPAESIRIQQGIEAFERDGWQAIMVEE